MCVAQQHPTAELPIWELFAAVFFNPTRGNPLYTGDNVKVKELFVSHANGKYHVRIGYLGGCLCKNLIKVHPQVVCVFCECVHIRVHVHVCVCVRVCAQVFGEVQEPPSL